MFNFRKGCKPLPLQILTWLYEFIMENIFHKPIRKGELRDSKITLSDQEKESMILKIAAAQNGKVTIAEIAKDTSLSLAESKAPLEKMNSSGVTEVQITDGGSLVYVFSGLLSPAEKDTSKDALNR